MKSATLKLIAGLGMLAAAAMLDRAEAQTEVESMVVPPHSVVAGKTLGVWSAEYFKWGLAIPVNDNPLLDTTGARSKFGDVGPVFFLGTWWWQGVPVPGPIVRSVTIPEDKFIFVPILALTNDNVAYGCTVPATTPCAFRLTIDQLYEQFASLIDGATAMNATIDGQPVNDLRDHREKAPAFAYTLQLTDNIVEVGFGYVGPDAVGTVFPAIADGFYLMLRPLPPGAHTIHITAATTGVSLNLTFHITVTQETSNQPAVLIP